MPGGEYSLLLLLWPGNPAEKLGQILDWDRREVLSGS